jgi:hypothetical protein
MQSESHSTVPEAQSSNDIMEALVNIGFPVGASVTNFSTPRPVLRNSNPSSPTSRISPTSRNHRTPDRFIPSSASMASFRMGLYADSLSPDERLLRRHIHGSAGNRRDRSISPTRRASVPGSPNIPSVRSSIGLGEHLGSSPLNNRTLSPGIVGIIGVQTLAQPADVVPRRQRGREIDGNIFADRRSPARELESHALRLSAALGVDRTRRVLRFSNRVSPGSGEGARRGVVPTSPVNQNPSEQFWVDVVENPHSSVFYYPLNSTSIRVLIYD